MNKAQKEQKKWLESYLGALVGGEITAVKAKAETEGYWTEFWPVLTIKLPSGQVLEVEVSQDEEGNGPGFLFGLPMPSREESA